MEAGRARPPCGCRHAWPRGGTPRSWICPGRAGEGRTVLPCLPSARSLIIAKPTVRPQGQHQDRHHPRGAPIPEGRPRQQGRPRRTRQRQPARPQAKPHRLTRDPAPGVDPAGSPASRPQHDVSRYLRRHHLLHGRHLRRRRRSRRHRHHRPHRKHVAHVDPNLLPMIDMQPENRRGRRRTRLRRLQRHHRRSGPNRTKAAWRG